MPSIKAGTGSGVSSNDLWIHCTCASQVGITYICICISISIRFGKSSAVMQRSPNFKLTCCRNTTTPAKTIVQHKAWHSSSGEACNTWDFSGDLRIIYCLVKMKVWGVLTRLKFRKKFLATFCVLSGNLKCTSAAMGSLNSCGVCEALAG